MDEKGREGEGWEGQDGEERERMGRCEGREGEIITITIQVTILWQTSQTMQKEYGN